jgi:hypothetical protein
VQRDSADVVSHKADECSRPLAGPLALSKALKKHRVELLLG